MTAYVTRNESCVRPTIMVELSEPLDIIRGRFSKFRPVIFFSKVHSSSTGGAFEIARLAAEIPHMEPLRADAALLAPR